MKTIEENHLQAAQAVIGRFGFAAKHGLHTAERDTQLAAILDQIKKSDVEVVRFAFVDAHGQLRARPIEVRHFEQAARNGVPFTTALLAMDSSNNIFMPVFSEDGGFGLKTMGGAGDVLGLADLATFRLLPWAKRTAWVLTDLYLSDGQPCPFDPRSIMKKACRQLADKGYAFMGGIELECHIFQVEDPKLGLSDCTQPPSAPSVSALRHGYQHVSELVLDELDERVISPIRAALLGLGLPLRTIESEFGPGQLEITLDPLIGVDAADAVIQVRSAVKQVMRRAGLLATFMSKPALPNVFSSGWHLHESLVSLETGQNSFRSDDEVISTVGRHFVGGILKHTTAATAFSNPTINGYKRINANPLTPKRAVWSIDNRAAMCRLIGGPGEAGTHIENRSGEPLANPYLYMASQIVAGLDGIDTQEDPGPPLSDPYAQTSRAPLPTNLSDAIAALADSELYRSALGDTFVDYYVVMKRHEIGRFQAYVTDWEHKEYFEAF